MSDPATPTLALLAESAALISGTVGFEEVVDATLDAMSDLLGHRHALLLLYDPGADLLVTYASRGYETAGIGSEVRIGEGVIGSAAAGRRSMRVGNLQRMISYLRTAQRSAAPDVPGAEIRLPGLVDARSQLAAPMIARGTLLGVMVAESERAVRYDDDDEHALVVVAQLAANALDLERRDLADDGDALVAPARPSREPAAEPARIRHYSVDGSTFIDDQYMIKGVAGRLLWKLASEHAATGRTGYTNREVRLDPALDMPSFKDNFESRLVLLKRRLEERDAPLRIHRPRRGQFEVEVRAPLRLERVTVSGT